jgi:hypothetical protein
MTKELSFGDDHDITVVLKIKCVLSTEEWLGDGGVGNINEAYGLDNEHTVVLRIDNHDLSAEYTYVEGTCTVESKEIYKCGGETCNKTKEISGVLKDNHVDFAGGIKEAIASAKRYCKETGRDLKIEIEVRNTDEINQALEAGVDRIMLDNFTPERTREAVELINGRVEIESSGGITIDTLRAYGECGVDYISVGALTHSVKGLDMSFKAC